jgi:hypothetical protein
MDQTGIIARRFLTAAFAVTTASALLAVAQPASAALLRPCQVEGHRTTSGVTKIGTATATVVPDGIKVTTARAANPDKVTWKTTFRPVAAGTVKELSYETQKLDAAGEGVSDAAVPAYQIFVKTPAGEGTLVYEPYWTGVNPPRGFRIQWDVLAGKLWTPSTTIAGLPKTAGGPATNTFAEVVRNNPRMTVTGVGFGLGTYNPGVVSIVDELRIAAGRDCADHQWSTEFSGGRRH